MLTHCPGTTLADAVPSPSQRRLAWTVAAILVLYGLAIVPLAEVPGPVIPNFIGVHQTAVVLADLLTAILLFAQFREFRQLGQLALGGAYLFTAAMAIAHMLSFPGLFSAQGMLGGSQTTTWLWVFWHGGFPAFIVAYVALERLELPAAPGSEAPWWLGAGLALAMAGGLAWLAASGLLPPLVEGTSYERINASGIGPAMVALCVVALALVSRSKGSTVVKLWLAVALLAFTLEVVQNLDAGARFSVGWYAARFNSLIASVTVLAVYVVENSLLLRAWVRVSRELSEVNGRLLNANAELGHALAEQRRLAAEAEAATAAKSSFLAAASHDIRQPVQSLMLFMGLLQTKLEGKPEAAILTTMEQAIGGLRMLLDSLLDLSRLDAGVIQPKIDRFPLLGLLDNLEAEYKLRAAQHGLELRVVKTGLKVESDPMLLGRLLRNLIENAVRHTETGTVLVGCRRVGGRVRILVHDTGPGIPEERHAEIFNEFVQIDNPERDRDKGLGLGLAIVRRLGGLLGHRVGLRSAPGRGSCFWVEVARAE